MSNALFDGPFQQPEFGARCRQELFELMRERLRSFDLSAIQRETILG
jgi:hypothetical protein